MYRISALFEEDLEMQDELENLNGLTDDTDDIIIATIDERYPLECKSHLFENEVPIVNEEGFTEDEETAINIAILNDECDLELEHEDDELLNEALTPKQKKMLKIGAAVAGATALGYGAYKYNQNKNKQNEESSTPKVDEQPEGSGWKKELEKKINRSKELEKEMPSAFENEEDRKRWRNMNRMDRNTERTESLYDNDPQYRRYADKYKNVINKRSSRQMDAKLNSNLEKDPEEKKKLEEKSAKESQKLNNTHKRYTAVQREFGKKHNIEYEELEEQYFKFY